MSDHLFEQSLESLAEAVVMLLPDERMPLENVRAKFQRLVALLPDNEEQITAIVADAVTHIDRHLGGTTDPTLVTHLGEMVEQVQRLARDIHSDEQAQAINEARHQFIELHAHTGEMLITLLRRAVRNHESMGLTEFRRIVHSLKGEAGVLGLDDLHTLCHRIENALVIKPLPLAWLGDACSWLDRYFHFLAGGDPPGHVSDADSGSSRAPVFPRTSP